MRVDNMISAAFVLAAGSSAAFSPASLAPSARAGQCVSLSMKVPASTQGSLSTVAVFEEKAVPEIYVWSDLHADRKNNFDRIMSLGPEKYNDAYLILPGDVSEDLHRFQEVLVHLNGIFKVVMFVPGNHDLWMSGAEKLDESYDSIQKFHDILAVCSDIGVYTRLVHIKTPGEEISIVPIFSWYVHKGDGEDTLYQPRNFEDKFIFKDDDWRDFIRCKWPEDIRGGKINQYFDQLNDPVFSVLNRVIVPKNKIHRRITCSHFLPDPRLLWSRKMETDQDVKQIAFEVAPPEDARAKFDFSKVAGALSLLRRIVQYGSELHIYGHQHRKRNKLFSLYDKVVRFINAALGNDFEIKHNLTHVKPLRVYPRLDSFFYMKLAAYDKDPRRFHPYMRDWNDRSDGIV